MNTMTELGLLSPCTLGPHALKNRLAMAPMTRNRAGPGNVPTELSALYYRQRASAGLIISEASQVSPRGIGYPKTPGIHTAEQVEGWRGVTEAVHDEHGKIFLQLWHVGRISHPSHQPGEDLPVAPSPVRPRGQAFTPRGLQPFVTPRGLETEEIPGIVEEYRRAAEHAQDAGFDGVEIHAANGYLIDQFLRDGTNHRTDRYGGSLENRCRFLVEVAEAVTSVWGGDRVGVRFSPGGAFNDMTDSNPEELFLYAAELLNEFHLAYLHAVEVLEAVKYFPFDRLRATFNGAYMANGAYALEHADEAVRKGRADLVSFGAAFLANPDLPERFARGAALNEADETAFYGGGEKGYTDYPFLDG